MERKETLARIRIPLSEGADTEANLKNNAYINLIASYKQDKKLPYRSDLRLNISIDGLIFKGPIKKQDFKRLMDFLLLFGSDFDRSSSKLQILNSKLHKFMKFKASEKKKIQKKRGEKDV